MDRFLADFILNHGEAAFPYVLLRAIHVNYGDGDYVSLDHHKEITERHLDALKISGFVDYDKKGPAPRKVRLLKDGKFLGYPEDFRTQDIEDEMFVPRELQQLVEIVGYPGDWEKSIPKYRKLYVGLASEVPSPIIASVAIWTAREHPDYGLNMFLSRNCFKSLKSKMESPKPAKPVSRTEASGYDEYDSFEEYDRKLLNGN